MLERLAHGIFGAILGAAIAGGVLFWFVDDVNWLIVAGAAGLCGLFAAILGEGMLDLLKEIWWWS